MALREILVELGIKVDKGDQKKAEGAVDKITDKLGKLRKFAIGAGAVFLTGKIAQGFAGMITMAGDAAEIVSKFGAVFVEEADAVAVALDDMADRTGQSSLAIKEMAADAGALVKPLVGTSKATAALAEQMTETALDIASFENVLPQAALGALRSAIIGSSEPMLRFGVDTRAAALEQFALEKGLTKSTKEMASAEITALRMELIMKRLGEKGAIGDATKTAGSFANRLKAVRGRFSDLVVEIGTEFLPIATRALESVLGLIEALGPGLVKAGKSVATTFRVIRGVVLGLLSPFQRLDTALLFLSSVTLVGLIVAFKTVGAVAVLTAAKAAAAWVVATLPLILMAVLIAAIGVAIGILVEDIVAMGKGHDSVTGTMILGIEGLIEKYDDLGLVIGDMLSTALLAWLKFFGLSDEAAKTWIDDLTDTLNNFWPNITEPWLTSFRSIVAKLDKMFNGLLDDWNKSLRNFVIGIEDDLIGLAGDLFGGGEDDAAAERARNALSKKQRAREEDRRLGLGISRGEAAKDIARSDLAERQRAREEDRRLSLIAGMGVIRQAGALGTAVPATTGAAGGAGGARTMINQPRIETNVNIDATGTGADPKAVGGVVRREIESTMEQAMSQARDAFAVAMAEGG